MTTADDLRACSSALFVMAERTPRMKRYRDVLETVISSAMDCVAKSNEQQRTDHPQPPPPMHLEPEIFTPHEQQAVESLMGLSSTTQAGKKTSVRTQHFVETQMLTPTDELQQLPTREPLATFDLQEDIMNWPMESLFDFQWQADIPDTMPDVAGSIEDNWQPGPNLPNDGESNRNVWAGDKYGLNMINSLLAMDP